MSKKIETVQKDILKIETWIEKKSATLEKKLKISQKAGYLTNYNFENIFEIDQEILYSELRSSKEKNEKQTILDSIYSIIATLEDFETKSKQLSRSYKILSEFEPTEKQNEKTEKTTEIELIKYIKNEIDNIQIPSLEKWLNEYKNEYIKTCNQHLNGYNLTLALRNVDQAVKDQKIKIITKTYDKVGKIVDVAFGKIGFDGSFNGIVIGEKGSVNIETILAGGYNIQKLHYRVLVK